MFDSLINTESRSFVERKKVVNVSIRAVPFVPTRNTKLISERMKRPWKSYAIMRAHLDKFPKSRKVLRVINTLGAVTTQEVGDELGLTKAAAVRSLKFLRAAKMIYVKNWIVWGAHNYWTPLYSIRLGEEEDALPKK